MSKLALSVACWNYDRVAPLRDGRVAIEGVDAHYFSLSIEELFYRVFHNHEFDITEISFSSYMMAICKGPWEYQAIPVFLSRMFRHSAIFVREGGSVKTASDLRGKRVGVPEYAQTAAVTVRGILKDRYGVDASDIRWITGGLEEPGREEKFPLRLPNGVVVERETRKPLNQMLVDGDIDALISARDPSSFSEGSGVVRLFKNHQEEERLFFKETGVFPIMHMVGIRRRLVDQYPWLPVSVTKAFTQAKDLCLREIGGDGGTNMATVPWMADAVAEAVQTLGNDYWPYGIERNRKALETLIRWSRDQGLIDQPLTPDALFAPSTRGEFKV